MTPAELCFIVHIILSVVYIYDHIDVYVLSFIRTLNQYQIYHFCVSQCYSILRMPRPHCWHCKYWTSSHVTLTHSGRTSITQLLHREGNGFRGTGGGCFWNRNVVFWWYEARNWTVCGFLLFQHGSLLYFDIFVWVLQTVLWTGWLSFVMSTLVGMSHVVWINFMCLLEQGLQL